MTISVDGDSLAVEGGENGKAFVQRTGSPAAALTVFYQVTGSAVSGVDYKPMAGTVTIPVGASRIKLKIKPIDNNTKDGTRVAKIKLLPATDGSYTLGHPTVVRIKITDRD